MGGLRILGFATLQLAAVGGVAFATAAWLASRSARRHGRLEDRLVSHYDSYLAGLIHRLGSLVRSKDALEAKLGGMEEDRRRRFAVLLERCLGDIARIREAFEKASSNPATEDIQFEHLAEEASDATSSVMQALEIAQQFVTPEAHEAQVSQLEAESKALRQEKRQAEEHKDSLAAQLDQSRRAARESIERMGADWVEDVAPFLDEAAVEDRREKIRLQVADADKRLHGAASLSSLAAERSASDSATEALERELNAPDPAQSPADSPIADGDVLTPAGEDAPVGSAPEAEREGWQSLGTGGLRDHIGAEARGGRHPRHAPDPAPPDEGVADRRGQALERQMAETQDQLQKAERGLEEMAQKAASIEGRLLEEQALLGAVQERADRQEEEAKRRIKDAHDDLQAKDREIADLRKNLSRFHDEFERLFASAQRQDALTAPNQ